MKENNKTLVHYLAATGQKTKLRLLIQSVELDQLNCYNKTPFSASD